MSAPQSLEHSIFVIITIWSFFPVFQTLILCYFNPSRRRGTLRMPLAGEQGPGLVTPPPSDSCNTDHTDQASPSFSNRLLQIGGGHPAAEPPPPLPGTAWGCVTALRVSRQAAGRHARDRRGAARLGRRLPAAVRRRPPRGPGVRVRVAAPPPLGGPRVRVQAARPGGGEGVQHVPPVHVRGLRGLRGHRGPHPARRGPGRCRDGVARRKYTPGLRSPASPLFVLFSPSDSHFCAVAHHGCSNDPS